MRDRFPLLVLGGLLIAGVLGTTLMRAAARGSFADRLSTYRSEEDGARALYLLAEEAGLRVARNRKDLTVLEPGTAIVILGMGIPSRGLERWLKTSGGGATRDGGTAGDGGTANDAGVTADGGTTHDDGGTSNGGATSGSATSGHPVTGSAAHGDGDGDGGTAASHGGTAATSSGPTTTDGGTVATADDDDESLNELEKLLGDSAGYSKEEQEALLEHVKAGSTLVLVPWGQSTNTLIDAAGMSLDPSTDEDSIRTLVPSQPSLYTTGVERVEAKVRAVLALDDEAVPLLVDDLSGEIVLAVGRHGLGRILVLTAPELATNAALARADNAQLWLSLLRASAGSGRALFDEYHHGFTSERSLAEFAARYGLPFAILQLLAGLGLWALALRRFGRPRPPAVEERVSGLDVLSASARLYREGRHHGYAAELLLRGLSQELASRAGVPARSPPDAVVKGLRARGRPDLAVGLEATAQAAHDARHERDVEKTARAAASTRALLT